MYVTGGSALLPQLDAFFSESLQIEVECFNPFERIGVGAKVDESRLVTDGAVIASTAGLALHAAGLARFAINLLPPSLVEARREKAKIPFVIAAGVALVAALVLVMLGLNHDTAVISAQRDAVQVKVDSLTGFDRKVKAAEEKLAVAQADSEKLRQLLAARSNAAQQLAVLRSSLTSGMWIEKWEPGKVTIRYWKDRVKSSSGKTPGEQVVDKLKGKAIVDPKSLKISDMSVVGKDAQVEQFTVELKFK